MRFHRFAARPNWRYQVQELGFNLALLEDPPYWMEAHDEPFCAEFSKAELKNVFEPSVRRIMQLALELVDKVTSPSQSDKLCQRLKIAPAFLAAIYKSWQRKDPTLYGRLDWSYNEGQFKLLELNLDTPTSLFESALLQKLWLGDLQSQTALDPAFLQLNVIHEKLLDAFKRIIPEGCILHVATFRHAKEESENCKYLTLCARAAGINAQFMYMEQIEVDAEGNLRDWEQKPIHYLFKLYPWEFLIEDDERNRTGGKAIFAPIVEENRTHFLEPAWKSILSNKGALPLLWEMAPGHENLLEAYFDDGNEQSLSLKSQNHVKKPIFGREGAGVSIKLCDEEITSKTETHSELARDTIIQKYTPLAQFDGYHIVIGTWIVAGEFAGISVRADKSKITGRKALFVPHYVS